MLYCCYSPKLKHMKNHNNKIKISACLITDNHEKYIVRAIESILSQKINDLYKIFIFDNRSTDNTPRIIKEYAQKYPDKIKLILNDKKRQGGKHLEKSLRSCHGEYIALLSGDDYWAENDKLKKQINFLEKHSGCNMSIHNANILDQDNKFLKIYYQADRVENFENINIKYLLIQEKNIPVSSIVFRSNILENIPSWIFDYELIEWSVAVFCAHYGKIKYFDEILSAHRESNQKPSKNAEESIIELINLINKHFNLKYDQYIKQDLLSIYDNLLNKYLYINDKKNSQKYAKLLIKESLRSKNHLSINKTIKLLLLIITGNYYIKYKNFSLLKKIKKTIKEFKNNAIKNTKRKSKKIKRIFITDKNPNKHTIVIMCVKRIAYVHLAIENLNSLHYINPNHNFEIWCDNICYQEYLKNKNKVDYPKKVNVINKFGKLEKRWQYYKILTFIDTCRNNYIMIDADSVWHDDLVIDKNKIYLLVAAYRILDNNDEKIIVKNIFGKEFLKYMHYVSAFLYIPPQYYTKQLEKDLLSFYHKVADADMNFIEEQEKKEILKRMSDEFAINFAIQKNCPEENITALKTNDSPKSRQSMQSLYYGCINKNLE